MEIINKPKRTPLTTEQRKRRVERARLLKSLVYEMWDGKLVYYADYKDVLKGTVSVKQVMSSSILQSRLVVRLSAYLLSVLELTVYNVLGNELGVQFKKGDRQGFDSGFDYYERKTTKFLELGVERVTWLFTQLRKVWVAESGKDWLIRDWANAVEILPGYMFVLNEPVATPKN